MRTEAELDRLLMRTEVISTTAAGVLQDLGPMDGGRIACICPIEWLSPDGPAKHKEKTMDETQSHPPLTVSGNAREMPRYKCHKEVHALKITEILLRVDGTMTFIPDDPGYAPIVLDAEFVTKHNPQNGGYYVVYEDGYKSFSPTEAFELGYTLISQETPR